MPDYEPRSNRYRPVDPAIWTDQRIQTLSPMLCSPLALLLFLKTCREGGFIPGVVSLGVAAAAEILCWDPIETRKALDELCEFGFVKADVQARLVYILGAVSAHPPANPNIVTSWRTTWHEIMPCPLKEEIWQELYTAMNERGKAFEDAFLRACPKGPGNGFSYRSRSGSRNGSGNKDKDPDKEKDPEQENGKDKDKESRTGLGQVSPPPCGGMVQSGSLGEGPGQSSGSCPGQVSPPPGVGTDQSGSLGEGPGQSSGSCPGHVPEPGSPRTSGSVLGQVDSPHRCVQTPDPQWDETIDDVEARESSQSTPQAPVPSLATQENPVVNPGIIPPAVQKIIDGWNERVVAKNPQVFHRYMEEEARKQLHEALKALEDQRSEHAFEVLFEACPRLPFMQGKNKTGFVATLGRYITKYAAGDFGGVEVAEAILKRQFHIDVKSPKPKSKAEAEAAQLRTSGAPQPPAAGTNNLNERMRGGRG